jgi:hypothetical protein
MRRIPVAVALLAPLLLTAMPTVVVADGNTDDVSAAPLDEITVNAQRIANREPAGSYAAPATALRFDPLTELQSRGIAEGQSDVTVRGGVFENTGFKLGAVTVMDPQTGHYVAELAVDPSLLSVPGIYKGIDNAIEGFNSAIATIAYDFRAIDRGGHVSLGAGTENLSFQTLRLGFADRTAAGDDWGAALSVARSEGDGTVPFGDHRFARYNLQLQHRTAAAQTDVIAAYQDKFYGWPGAYTGFATLPETDDTQTTLLSVNHRHDVDRGWWEVGAFYRRLVDDYDFDRTTIDTGGPGSFEHETRIVAVGLQGLLRSGQVSWRYGAQLTADELVRSTDLTNGRFNDRRYATATVVPQLGFDLAEGRSLTVRAGATADYSNRDGSAVSPLAGVTHTRLTSTGHTDISLEYAQTSQLPGYTALNSGPSGLFGGNPDLGRERAKQLSLSVAHEGDDWQGRAALFIRRDDDLVDWTFATGAPFARQANPVDLDVVGVEAFVTRRWALVDLAVGYTWLDKDSDYGSADVDASFYALNFARHRMTLALRYRFADRFELRLDNEYRRQEQNPLRTGDDATYLAALAITWNAEAARGFNAMLVVDNLTDSEFQPFPGTPASGRQVSLTAGYAW